MFFVGYLGDDPVVTGAWRRRRDVAAHGTDDAAEVKRMYVAPEGPWPRARPGDARAPGGHRAGRGRRGDDPRERHPQPEAMALYESSGYTLIPGFAYYKDSPRNRSYARPL